MRPSRRIHGVLRLRDWKRGDRCATVAETFWTYIPPFFVAGTTRMPVSIRCVIVLVCGLLLPPLAAAQPDSLVKRFETANAAYERGRYARALSQYRGILRSGYASGALYYNLGNTYVRLDKLGQGIRHYEKALRVRPEDPRIQHNLEQARRWANVDRRTIPPRRLLSVVQNWSPVALYVAGLFLFGVGLATAIIRYRPARTEATNHPLVWGPISVGLLIVALALGTSGLQSLEQRAVVVVDHVQLRTEPNADAAADTTLAEGTLVEVRRRQSGWRHVRSAGSIRGWVPAEVLGEI